MSIILISAGEYFLPVWVQVVIGIAATVVAVGIIWKKIVRPTANLITLLDKAVPLLSDLVEEFKDTPHAFQILNEIIAEFRTDSGTTLRDVVDRLEKAAKDNSLSGKLLAENAEVARKLSEQDRLRMAELTELVNQIRAKDKVVASDLAESQQRAHEVKKMPDSEAGAAADVAALPLDKK